MRIIRCIIVCTILGTTPFAIAQEKPNVVMILADDIGYGDIGAQETNLIDRPEYGELIDRLRAKFLEHNDHKSVSSRQVI